ncbi:DNA replication/repair protein RecF [Candidatus Margulisiibacteriota bacterium]
MRIKKLCLTHFRNYSSRQIEFSPNISFFYGKNAQGKTNLLEAIHLLCTAQSPRTRKTQDTVSWGEAEALIEGVFVSRGQETEAKLQISKSGEKTIRIGRQYLKKTSDLLGQFPAIFFSPDDLEIIKKTPQGRRRFLDLLFSQASKKYTNALLEYQKILKQRNECLCQIAEHKTNEQALEPWDEALITTGLSITNWRKQGLEKIVPVAEAIHQELTAGKESLQVKYLCSLGETKEQAKKNILKHRRNELATKKSCFGPHRDDLAILIDQREAKAYASHGQQHTAILSLKLAEFDYIKKAFGETPIVLLDDILLELDSSRFAALLKNLLEKTQAIMTGTEIGRFQEIALEEINFYEVSQGCIKENGPVKVA